MTYRLNELQFTLPTDDVQDSSINILKFADLSTSLIITRAVLAEIETRLKPAVVSSGPAEIQGLLKGLAGTFAMPGLLGPDEAARDLLRGVAQGREHIVLPRRIGWLSQALSLLPARWHDRILLGQPRKPRAHQAGATPIPGLSHPHDKT